MLNANEPSARAKIYRLGEWQERDIKDPYRQPLGAFEAALSDIDEGVAEWAKRIAL